MLEIKLVMKNNGTWTVYTPDGVYSEAQSLNEVPEVTRKLISGYTTRLNQLADKKSNPLEKEIART